MARVACETLVTTGLAFVTGEITTSGWADIPQIVRSMLRRIGYVDTSHGIDANTCAVLTTIDRQSSDIAMGVDTGGAGDQGMMFGYASNETDSLMPAPIQFAHNITRRLAGARKSGELPWLRPDGKSQVTVEYEGDCPVRVSTVVVSAQHAPGVSHHEIREGIIRHVITPVLPERYFDPKRCTFHINPTGRFEVGGPHGDAGLTGRKIIVDSYGGAGRHGGGAFSGKDPTKVDRSATYAARWAAKNVVAAGAARRCEIQVAYAIGVAEPVSIHVDTFDTAAVPEDEISRALAETFDFRPRAIIETLGLRKPIYTPTAAYGHFGRSPEVVESPIEGVGQVSLFPWERTDRVDALRTALRL
jgi:S-adenosylmethionine synthetase